MLRNTFCHIPGIGLRKERHLWACGIHTWEYALESPNLPLSPAKTAFLRFHLRQSQLHLQNGIPSFFTSCLAASEHWRFFPEFRRSVAYLDIETTGIGGNADYITTIALYDGDVVRCYVHDENLHQFAEEIRDYCLLVTYNGKCFDLPFIRNYLGLRMDQAHIDLRFVLRTLGYRGGLKGCERHVGINRGDLEGMDGRFAVYLWFDFLNRGNRRALETLLAYNIEDVLHLETLMVHAYNEKLKETPFCETHRLPYPPTPANPFHADRETIERIRHDYYASLPGCDEHKVPAETAGIWH